MLNQVKAMLMSTGEDGKTLLSLAVRSGSKGAFEAVLAALSSEEVCRSQKTTHDAPVALVERY